MSDNMNSRIFAKKWLEREGLFDKDSDYDGWLGTCAMQVVDLIAKQGHSGASGPQLVKILASIYEAYETSDSPIWRDYWESTEGKALLEQYAGEGASMDFRDGVPVIRNKERHEKD